MNHYQNLDFNVFIGEPLLAVYKTWDDRRDIPIVTFRFNNGLLVMEPIGHFAMTYTLMKEAEWLRRYERMEHVKFIGALSFINKALLEVKWHHELNVEMYEFVFERQGNTLLVQSFETMLEGISVEVARKKFTVDFANKSIQDFAESLIEAGLVSYIDGGLGSKALQDAYYYYCLSSNPYELVDCLQGVFHLKASDREKVFHLVRNLTQVA